MRRFFKRPLDVYFSFIPQVLFLGCIFGTPFSFPFVLMLLYFLNYFPSDTDYQAISAS